MSKIDTTVNCENVYVEYSSKHGKVEVEIRGLDVEEIENDFLEAVDIDFIIAFLKDKGYIVIKEGD